jgi:hypothetical protein
MIMNAKSFLQFIYVIPYIQTDGMDRESDYLSSLSPLQATQYFDQKVKEAQEASAMYSSLQKEKYYAILSDNKKLFSMVKGSGLLTFTVKVIPTHEIYRIVKSTVPVEDAEAFTSKIEKLFHHEVQAWKQKVEEYVSGINNLCELKFLPKSELEALREFFKKEKALFLSKASSSISDSRIRNINIQKAEECNLRIISLNDVLSEKGSS